MACKLFCFRHTAEKIPKNKVEETLEKWCSYWVYQVERGDSGYVHYQGAFSLKKKRRKVELVKQMKDVEGFAWEYCEPMPKSEAEHIRNVDHLLETYAAKFDTRVEGPFSSKPAEFRPWQVLSEEQLYPWQKQIVATADQRQERTINVLHDTVGCSGKSSVGTFLEFSEKGYMPITQDQDEIVAECCDYCMDNEIRTCTFIFDWPRGMRPTRELLTGIEHLKRGKLVDKRHHLKIWWINAPTVWIMCNELPPMKYLSKDRWRVWHINQVTLELEEGPDLRESNMGDA